MTTAKPCLHCPDGHPDPLAKPWVVTVHPDRNGDGRPVYLMVAKSDLAAARQAYELKVQDLAGETARLGKLIDVLALHGHSASGKTSRCLACSICRALREVTQ